MTLLTGNGLIDLPCVDVHVHQIAIEIDDDEELAA